MAANDEVVIISACRTPVGKFQGSLSDLSATQLGAIVVAGGMESMTNAPYLLPQARKGYRLGNAQIVDSMVNDGLWDIYNNYHMGITGENVAEKYSITRDEQDQFALNSHRKALAAIKECRFKSQIVPVELPTKKKEQAP